MQQKRNALNIKEIDVEEDLKVYEDEKIFLLTFLFQFRLLLLNYGLKVPEWKMNTDLFLPSTKKHFYFQFVFIRNSYLFNCSVEFLCAFKTFLFLFFNLNMNSCICKFVRIFRLARFQRAIKKI